MANQKQFRPLLAASLDTEEDFGKLRYPLIASPKVDGVRVVCHPEYGPCTRSLKPVPNRYIRSILSEERFWWFDGEITIGPPNALDVFARTISAVMTESGEPSFSYHVFDDLTNPTEIYGVRLERAGIRRKSAQHVNCCWLEWHTVKTREELDWYEQLCVADGFEGIMLRAPDGIAKWGRSTLKEGHLVKLKRFKDAEAVIIGFEPLQHNTNAQIRNQLGLAERSSHQAGKVLAQTLGALLCRGSGEFSDFSIGSGFDQATRQDIWDNRERYLGKVVTFKYQEIGVKEAPRFPIWKGFRPSE